MMIRENLTVRSYQMSDLQPMAEIANAVSAALGASYRTTAEELRGYFEVPSFDIANDSFLIESEGRVMGMSDLEFSSVTGRTWADGGVHPDFWGRGIGTRLVEMTEARALARAQAECSPEQPISIQRYTTDKNTAAVHLFEARGYYQIRTFYQMRKELDVPENPPPLPGNLVLRPFDVERDAHAIYEAHEEAFEDHWGFERETFEDWEHYLIKRPGADTSMWLIAYDGDEIAGLALNRPYGESDAEMAYVGVLAVRRPWRKQGLGTALLQQSFAVFKERGYTRAGLGVDASSLTNAVALYERAGMYVKERTFAYRKMLRGEDPEVTR